MKGLLRGQGATEYLVLLAVVLIVALVSVALLGFFPGMASDAQITQSKTYWQGASPIAIVDYGGAWHVLHWGSEPTVVNFRIRNNGPYPIRLNKMLGGGVELPKYHDTVQYQNMTTIYLGPGEEACFGHSYVAGAQACAQHSVTFLLVGQSGWDHTLSGASTTCDSSGGGVLDVKNFGFEYYEYIDNQQILKREIGRADLMIKCAGTVN